MKQFPAILSFILVVTSAAPSEALVKEEFKCLCAPMYFPGRDLLFDRAAADDIAFLNAGMLRMEFIGDENRTRTINYEVYDLIMEEAGKRGLSMLGLVAYQAMPVDHVDKSEWNKDSFRERYIKRLREIVEHYHAHEFPIRHWEIWNEPDKSEPGFDVRIEPEAYARLLIDAYATVKSIDPEATVILGGISSSGFRGDNNYLRDVYESQSMVAYRKEHGRHPFDVVAVHPYSVDITSIDPNLGDFLNQRVKATMNEFGDSDKQVWITRMGWNSREVGIPGQAERMERAYHFLDGLTDPAHPDNPPYIGRLFWFQYLNYEPENDWGLRTADRMTRKASYFTFARLSSTGPDPSSRMPGELQPVWGASSDAALAFQVMDDDLLTGLVPEIAGGFLHNANTGDLSELTDGQFGDAPLSVLLADYLVPSVRLRYTFPEPVDIEEVRSFAGHPRDWGVRSWQNIDIRINDRFGVDELQTGAFGQTSPNPGGAVSVVRWVPTDGERYVATNVKTLEMIYYPVSTNYDYSFLDPWIPKTDPTSTYRDKIRDVDGREPAFTGSLLKEIDVIGRLSPTPAQPLQSNDTE